MNSLVSLFVALVGILLAVEVANAAVAIGFTDTSEGSCNLERYGNIPVGEDRNFTEPCERVICGNGGYQVQSCGSVAGPDSCDIRPGEGAYPGCCPQIFCDGDAS